MADNSWSARRTHTYDSLVRSGIPRKQEGIFKWILYISQRFLRYEVSAYREDSEVYICT